MPPSERHVAQVRCLLGAYSLWHCAALLPYAGEVFGSTGMLPDASALPTSGVFPNLLALDGLTLPGWLLVFGCVASLLLGLGVASRPMALALWFVWATLLNRNPFIANPSIPYVGWLLLGYAVIPSTRTLRLGSTDEGASWAMPPWLHASAWLLLGLGYTLSGVDKLGSPSWQDGSALSHVLELPLARDTAVRELLLSLPDAVLRISTWMALAMELAALPLFALAPLRSFAWLALTGMQIALLGLIDFADLTVGMLVFHAFVFERGSLPRRPTPPRRPKSAPHVPGFSPGGVTF